MIFTAHRLYAFVIILQLIITDATAEGVSPSAYGALPYTQDVAISPDGQSLAILENTGNTSSVSFYDLKSGERLFTNDMQDIKARDITWGGNDYVLLYATISETIFTVSGMETYEVHRFISMKKDTGRSRTMFSGDPAIKRTTSSGTLVHTLPEDPEHVLMMQLHPASNTGWNLYRVNLQTGRERIIAYGSRQTDEWIVDHTGTPLFRVDEDSRDEKRRILTVKGKRTRELSAIDEPRESAPKFYFAGVTEDSATAYAVGNFNGERKTVHSFDIQSGVFKESIYEHPSFDVASVSVDYATKKPVSINYIDDFRTSIYLDSRFEDAATLAQQTLKADAIQIRSYSLDKMQWVIVAIYADKPPIYYLLDTEQRNISEIGPTYPQVGENVRIRRIRHVYKTSDGLDIPGYLTFTEKADSSGAPAPLVVLPHGGPHSRDMQAFDWWAGFYAARGYTVYQPNFRGSSGYGLAFEEAGYGQWGLKMQDDITQGVQDLITKNIADPDRICIVGASYGGYAALAGAAFTPDLYACAISVNGVSNLTTHLGAIAERNGGVMHQSNKKIGDRFRDKDKLNATSPERHANGISAPILLMHSDNDSIVEVGQSMIMRNALKKAGKQHEFIKLDGDDHWLSLAETRTIMLNNSIEFIDKHIGQ